MRWPLPVPTAVSGAPLTAEQLAAGRAAPTAPAADTEHCTRAEIAARAGACRTCPYSGASGSSCSDCDLRCTHPAAQPGEQLIARRASTCHDNRWPVLA